MSGPANRARPEAEIQKLREAMLAAPPGARVVICPVRVYDRTRFAAFFGRRRLSRMFTDRVEAGGHADMLQRRIDALRGQRERACMCCRKPFMSAGIHNRLCDYCRTHADDAGMW